MPQEVPHSEAPLYSVDEIIPLTADLPYDVAFGLIKALQKLGADDLAIKVGVDPTDRRPNVDESPEVFIVWRRRK